MAGSPIGSVSVGVVPSLQGFTDKLRAQLLPEADTLGADIGKHISDGISAELHDVRVGATVDLDTEAARAVLDDLASKHVDIGGSFDDSRIVAAVDNVSAKLDRLTGHVYDVELELNAGTAVTRLDEISEKLDEAGARTATPRLTLDDSSFNTKLDAAMARLEAASESNTGVLGAGIIGGIAASPAAGGLLAGAVGAVGGLGLAYEGVSGALKDYTAEQSAATTATGTSAKSAISSASQIHSAQEAVSKAETQAAHDADTSAESIKNAHEGVAQAVSQAANNQIGAEQQLANAQYAEKQAQQELTDARQQAILTLQQLHDAEADTALGAQQAQLDLEQAKLNAQTTDASSTATELQKQQADLSVAEAQQRLKEALEAKTNASNASNKADKEGVDGMPAVVTAQHNLQQAHQSVADAQRNLADVEQQGAQAIAKAQQSLADAVRNASWQQQADSQNVADAQYSLKTAYDQATASGTTAATAATKYADALAKLSPAGRELVKDFISLHDMLSPLEGAAEKAIAPGFTELVKGIHALVPDLTDEVTKMDTIIGGFLGDIGRKFESSGFKDELKDLFAEGNQFLQIVGPAIGDMLSDLLGAGADSPQLVKGLADGIASIARGFGDLFTNVSKAGPQAGSALAELGKLIGSAAGTAGDVLAEELRVLSDFLGFIAKLPPSVSKPLLDIVAAVLVLKKTGVLSVGVKIVSTGAKLLQKLFGGATAEVGAAGLQTAADTIAGATEPMQAAADTMITAAEAMQRAADTMIGAGGGKPGVTAAEEGAGGLGVPAEDAAAGAGGGLLSTIAAAAVPVVAGLLVGAVTRALSDSAAPKGTAAGADSDYYQHSPGAAANGTDLVAGFIGKFSTMQLGKDIANWESDVGKWFTQTLPAIITGSWAKTEHDTERYWDDIGSFLTGSWNKTAHDASTAFGSVSRFISGSWDQTRHDAAAAWDDITGFLTGSWDKLQHDAATDFDGVRHAIATAWSQTVSTVFNPMKTFFTSTIPGWYHTFISTTNSAFVTPFQNAFKGALTWVTNNVFTPLHNFFTGTIPGWFTTLAGAIGKAWAAVEQDVKAPVAWVVNNVFGKLATVFDDITKSLNIGIHIDVPHMAGGGKITQGTTPTADDVPVFVSRDETVVSAAHSAILAPAFRAVGVPGYADGGVPNPSGESPAEMGRFGPVPGVGGVVSSLKQEIGSLAGSALDAAVKHVLSPIVDAIPAGSDIGQMLKGMAEKAVDGIADVFKSTHTVVGGGGGSGAPSGPLSHATGSLPANYSAIASYLVGHGFTKAEAAGIGGNIFVESGGNPYIWEVDGGGGYGLIQWTPPPAGLVGSGLSGELAQIAREGTGMFSSPKNPAEAALQYLYGRERPLDPGATAATREASANAIAKAMGWKFDDGGWMPPGLSLTLNNTGRPEPVFSPQQWDTLSRSVAGGDGGTVRLHPKTVKELARAMDRSAGRTAAGVGGAINGAAHGAATRGRFRTR